ncbi:MAG: mandelate racemase/muconate lactonizing enzyme family protein [Chloroflexi bacterium]|nr:mandelate racemase/muconate lactonizing enzyme family protein [Chloroflexota bacterium]
MSPRITAVKAFRIGSKKDYVEWVGLRPPQMPERAPSASIRRALAANTGRHICAYPIELEALLIQVTVDDGNVGWGEAHSPPVPRVSQALVEDLLGPLLIGQDPLAIEAQWDRLYHSMRLRGHSTGFMMEALAGVDLALWDLKGKILGQPIYKLLGGPYSWYNVSDTQEPPRVPCYASGLPGATIEERLHNAETLVKQGFSAIKLSIGRGSYEDDLCLVETVAEALAGRADLLVDAHGCYDVRTAIPAARRMEAAGVRWLEDPLPPEDLDAYASLCAAVDLAIANGETECTRWQFLEKLRRGAADIILPDICRAGGISEGRRIADVADLFGVPWCAHVSSSSWPHRLAALHLAVATPNFLICEWPNPLVPNPLALGQQDLVTCKDGYLYLPPGNGLGWEIDEEWLAAYVIQE